MASLVKVQGEDLGEASGIAIHDGWAVSKSFQEGIQSLPLLHCRTQAQRISGKPGAAYPSCGLQRHERSLRQELSGTEGLQGDREAREKKSWHEVESSLPTSSPHSILGFPCCPCLTRKHLVPAGACDGSQVLHQMLTAGGLATATTAQEDDGLVLAAHQHCPIRSLGHSIDVGCHVLPPTPLEHVHHLEQERDGGKEEA